MTLDYNTACKVSDYLLLTGQGFCFVQSLGRIVDREECLKIITSHNDIRA